eukprot:492706-Prymnesium_polylepis.1
MAACVLPPSRTRLSSRRMARRARGRRGCSQRRRRLPRVQLDVCFYFTNFDETERMHAAQRSGARAPSRRGDDGPKPPLGIPARLEPSTPG